MTYANAYATCNDKARPAPHAGLPPISMGVRVYIAKITFTTLIDHFTSCMLLEASVYSNQLIKLALRTQSIRQQKLPPHLRNSAFDPAVRLALARTRKGSGRSYLASDRRYPIETAYSNKFRSESQQIFPDSVGVSDGLVILSEAKDPPVRRRLSEAGGFFVTSFLRMTEYRGGKT